MDWLTSQNRKRHQRAINKSVRRVNQAIEKDDLWHGRFVIRQERSEFYSYEDKSGAELWVVLCFLDKKTGTKWHIADTVNHFRTRDNAWLFYEMNRFIIEKAKAWENDLPYEDKTDYTKIKI